MRKTPLFFLLLILLFILSGCRGKTPEYFEREKAGEVPEVLMDKTAENAELPPDVAALLHELREKVSNLEKSFTGDIPGLKESLLPLEQNLNNLKNDLNRAEPLLNERDELLQELKIRFDTLREEIQE